MKHYKIMAAVIGLALFATGLCFAQEETSDKDQVSIILKSSRVSDALETLFKQRPELKYSFRDQEIDQTAITTNLPKVSFDTALRNILKAANLTYRKESDIYVITKQVDVIDNSITEPTTIEEQKNVKRTEKIKIQFADASMIAYMLGGNMLQIGGSYWQGNSNNNNGSNNGYGNNNNGGNNNSWGNNNSNNNSNRSSSSRSNNNNNSSWR